LAKVEVTVPSLDDYKQRATTKAELAAKERPAQWFDHR
jgi:hypothetical protein